MSKLEGTHQMSFAKVFLKKEKTRPILTRVLHVREQKRNNYEILLAAFLGKSCNTCLAHCPESGKKCQALYKYLASGS